MLSSLHWEKIEMSKSIKKVLKKEPREMENQRKNEKKKDEKKDKENHPSRDEKIILGLITLKYNLGLFILSFGTIYPSLHYIPEKLILIECGYLN